MSIAVRAEHTIVKIQAGAFTRILAAVDDSPRAAIVVAAAIALARGIGASVLVFRDISVPQQFPPAAATGPLPDPLPGYLRSKAQREIEILTADAADISLEIDVRETLGEFVVEYQAILAAAKAYGADLIIIGGHPHAFIERMLGTTAAKVAELAPIDVLIVRRPAG